MAALLCTWKQGAALDLQVNPPECEGDEERTKQEQIKEWNVAHKAISQHQLCTVCFVRLKAVALFCSR